MTQSDRRAELHQARKEMLEEDRYGRLVTVLDPTSAASEAYRTLRTNLLYACVDKPPKVILLTSPGPLEGKSTVCANMGVVLTQADKNVLIIDCDFRRPTIHKFFGLPNLRGIVDVLVGEHDLQEVWMEPVEGLKIVPGGPVPPNPTELLSSQRFSELLTYFREDFDYVLVDAPPTGLVSDPTIIAAQADGVLLVLHAQKTSKGSLRRAVRRLKAVRANVLGTVMNNVKISGDDY